MVGNKWENTVVLPQRTEYGALYLGSIAIYYLNWQDLPKGYHE